MFKKEVIKMSVPDGYAFNTDYTMNDTKHNKHYWETDRNLDPWKTPVNVDFSWHLDKVAKKITDLLNIVFYIKCFFFFVYYT
mgnify:CR=1 FL=1